VAAARSVSAGHRHVHLPLVFECAPEVGRNCQANAVDLEIALRWRLQTKPFRPSQWKHGDGIPQNPEALHRSYQKAEIRVYLMADLPTPIVVVRSLSPARTASRTKDFRGHRVPSRICWRKEARFRPRVFV